MSAFQHVLVGLDLNEVYATALLERACQVADQDRIEAIHACDNTHQTHHEYPIGYFSSSEQLDEAVRRNADSFMERVCRPVGVSRHVVLDGPPAPTLHGYARNRADLIVVGSHGRTGLIGMLGSTSNDMLHGTECNVLAVHLDDDAACGTRRYGTVMACIDLSNSSFQVLDTADAVAQRSGADLVICHVSNADQAKIEREYDRLLHFADAYGVEPFAVHSPRGATAREIHALASQLGVDLVVIGNHGKRGLALLTGSKANAVLHGATCDELSVRIN